MRNKKNKLTRQLQAGTSKYSIEGAGDQSQELERERQAQLAAMQEAEDNVTGPDQSKQLKQERQQQLAMIREAELNVAGPDQPSQNPPISKKQAKKAIERTDKETSIEQKRQVVAEATGQSVEEVAAKTTDSKGKEKKKGGLSSMFKDALVQLAPSAIGLAVGAAIEGSAGGAAGFEAGNKLGQQLQKNRLDEAQLQNSAVFSDIQQQQVDLKVSQQDDKKFAKDIFDTRTGARALQDKEGNVLTQDGEILPIEYQQTDSELNRKRLQEQGDTRIDISRANTALRDKALENRIEEQGDADKFKVIDTVNKNKEVMAAREAITKGQAIRKLIDVDSVFAPGAAVIGLNRLAGNVGVLSDIDMAIFGGSQAFDARISRWIKKSKDGKLNKSDKADILSAVNTLQGIQEGKIRSVEERTISQVSKASSDVSASQARDLLDNRPVDVNTSVKNKLFGRE